MWKMLQIVSWQRQQRHCDTICNIRRR